MKNAMETEFRETLDALERGGNLRRLPADLKDVVIDFTSNDYLGFGTDAELRDAFYDTADVRRLALTSSASRLLAGAQETYFSLEKAISDSYKANGCDGEVLLFNSGYHANTGVLSAIVGRGDVVLADRLVHASIIDGVRLSGAEMVRFRHNDCEHLESLMKRQLEKLSPKSKIVIVVESVYSMDGDRADLKRIAEIKRLGEGRAMLYVDEAHAVGVCGPRGLGETLGQSVESDVDVMVGTLGKALASLGAFVVTDSTLKDFLINRSRSLIFSTALPPLQAAWSEFVWRRSLEADDRRTVLRELSALTADIIPGAEPSHIRPLIVGDARKAVALSRDLLAEGFNVLPIRTPTVPAGSERLRFSLSASGVTPGDIQRLGKTLNSLRSVDRPAINTYC